MPEDPIVALISEQDWLEPLEKKGQKLLQAAFDAAGEHGPLIKDALHGVWLKHPLHSAITDVPVGSWTAAAVMDVLEATGHGEYAAGADAAVAVGLVGATLAAASGLADWSETQGKAQRVGSMHGLLNGTAALLYAGSFVARKTGNRTLGRALALLGYGIVAGSAYLGGALSYNLKVGVNHAPLEEDLPQEWKPTIPEANLSEKTPQKVDVEGIPVLLVKRGNEIHALANQCSHAGGPLVEGQFEETSVTCPWHGSCFELRSGKVKRGPATCDQTLFDVKVENRKISVKG